jgi:hypothetical protein
LITGPFSKNFAQFQKYLLTNQNILSILLFMSRGEGKMRKILEECPTCGGDVIATELSCTNCDTVIRSQYAPCLFCRLSPEDLAFVELFVMNRGNVKEMERELGISYWSIRGRLDEIVQTIGSEEPEPDEEEDVTEPYQTQSRRRDILERLDRGEISVAEATDLLTRSE